jgi:hypothetical protein
MKARHCRVSYVVVKYEKRVNIVPGINIRERRIGDLRGPVGT